MTDVVFNNREVATKELCGPVIYFVQHKGTLIEIGQRGDCAKILGLFPKHIKWSARKTASDHHADDPIKVYTQRCVAC